MIFLELDTLNQKSNTNPGWEMEMEDEIDCPKCRERQCILVEYEDAAEGSKYDCECNNCGHWFKFEISYLPCFNVIE